MFLLQEKNQDICEWLSKVVIGNLFSSSGWLIVYLIASNNISLCKECWHQGPRFQFIDGSEFMNGCPQQVAALMNGNYCGSHRGNCSQSIYSLQIIALRS